MEEGWPHSPSKCVKSKSEFTAGFLLPTPCTCVHAKSLQSTLRTVASKAPLSMGFSRQEYWSRWPCAPPGDLPDPGDQTHISHVSCIDGRVLYPGTLSHSTSAYSSEKRTGASLLTSLSLTFPDL